ncbi:MAG TPA: hypothetical protein DER40_10175 [Geobacter sp.]|nr:MAG: hypothetical protein A2X85_02245 [Geobacteraceae bacterium GWF2_54_21]HBA71183.1 hypothetical protein [Geobacter sp.]HCE67861.1 hypothetical protein [Geobacter sp.]
MKVFITFVLVLFLMLQTAMADSYDFRGIKLGMGKTQATSIASSYEGFVDGDSLIGFYSEINGTRVESVIIFYDYLAAEIRLKFSYNQFQAVKKHFIKNYGKPTSDKNIIKQNLFGATFEFNNVIWLNKNYTIIGFEDAPTEFKKSSFIIKKTL